MTPFSVETYAYFDAARRNACDRAWFERRQQDYQSHVAEPFSALVMAIDAACSKELPGVEIPPRKIVKPVRRQAAGPNGAVIRSSATAFFAEPATSRFEMNPGIYLSLGAEAQDNVIGLGLYLPSSRQIKRLRVACGEDHRTLDECLAAPAVRAAWGGLAGERYQRFPKDFDENALGAQYLWHKQFFLGKDLSREEVMRPDFAKRSAAAFAAALPFLQWVRAAVGVYLKPASGHGQGH